MEDKHILLAEDEEGLRESLAFLLDANGYFVTTARDGGEAYEKIKELQNSSRPVDLLITDVQMPSLTGIELIGRLKESDIHLLTLAVTGFGDKPMVVELLRKGCNEFLDKPFAPEEVLKRVAGLLGKGSGGRPDGKDARDRPKDVITGLSAELESCRRRYSRLLFEVESAVKVHRDLMRYNPEGILMHTALRSHPADQQGSCFVGVGNTLRGCDILVADVTGRDMGTAYRTLMLKTFFDENCRAEKDPETFFRLVNRWLIENDGNDRMLTALFMRLDFAAMTGEIVSAGRPIVVRKCAGMPGPSLVETGGDVLGLHTEIHPASRTLHLRPGDRFFLGTESLIDTSPRYASTEKRKRLGKAGLLELVGRHAGLPLECATEGIWNGLLRFCRFEPEDDMVLLGVEVP